MNIFKLLRTYKSPLNNLTLSSTTRGAKRKGEKKSDAVLSEHILNVYKNRDDVAILPDEYYPPWVLRLAEPQMKVEEMIGNAAWGMTLPEHCEQKTMMNKVRRQMNYKLPNRLRLAKVPWEVKWEKKEEGIENHLDTEWGDLPQIIEKYAMEELKGEEGSGGGAPAGNIYLNLIF
jgi:hypothetical protein